MQLAEVFFINSHCWRFNKFVLLSSQLHHRVPSGDDSVHLLCVVGFAGKEQVVLICLGEIGELDFRITGGMEQRFSLMLCTELPVALQIVYKDDFVREVTGSSTEGSGASEESKICSASCADSGSACGSCSV